VSGLGTSFGSGAMTNSIEDLAKAKAFLIIGSNTTEAHPVIGALVKRTVRNGAKLIVADPRRIELARMATMYLRQQPGTNLALLNGMARVIINEGLYDKHYCGNRTEGLEALKAVVQKYTPAYVETLTGIPAADVEKAARLYATNRPATILYCLGVTEHITGHATVMAIANLAMLTGNVGVEGGGVNPLRGQNNVQGACDMGALADVYPGYQKVSNPDVQARMEQAWGVPLSSKPGATLMEMMNAACDGTIKAMYITGENPMMTDPDLHHVEAALRNLDFLVVQDIVPTETTALADVILPAAAWAEKDGTFTNTERRVQLVRKAVEPPGEARPDWEIVSDLARRLLTLQGASDDRLAAWRFDSPAAIMVEVAGVTPQYAGIRHERLQKNGLQWPCPTLDHPGTKILHRDRFSCGLGKFSALDYTPSAEITDSEYPLLLTTGRRLQHYHSGTMTHRVAGLNTLLPEERMEIHPDDAAGLGLADGDRARVRSRRGEVTTRVRLTDRIKPGVVFLDFHFPETAVNLLTNAALDPVAKVPEYKVASVQVQKV
jgi:formate dehydrogenase alpha subunit